jgi:protoporphyrinogen oxidase
MSKKNKHIDLFKEIIPCVDLNQKGLWDAVDEDARKEIKSYLYNLIRYISGVKNASKEVQAHYVLTVNEYFNKNFFALQKDPKLLWMLLCMCNYDGQTTFFHEYIPHKRPTTKKIDFLASIYPSHKIDDIELMSELMSDFELKELAEGHGIDDATIKKLIK